MTQQDIAAQVRTIALEAKQAARTLAYASTARKNAVLQYVVERPARVRVAGRARRQRARHGLCPGCQPERRHARPAAPRPTRGSLAIAGDIEAVMRLPDPVGQIESLRELESGISAGRMSVPLGVIAMIYESRPNVTADAAALCIKSGNALHPARWQGGLPLGAGARSVVRGRAGGRGAAQRRRVACCRPPSARPPWRCSASTASSTSPFRAAARG